MYIFYIKKNTIYGGKKMSSKNIKCEVESCKHNNKDDNYCTLKEIKISSTCKAKDTNKEETICDSFEKNS